MSFDELPLPVICLILERIEGLTPERLVMLSPCFANRKWLQACREDVPWRAALRNTGGVTELPKCGLYRWFVGEYVLSVAKAKEELQKGYTCVWFGGGLYSEAEARISEREIDSTAASTCAIGVGSDLRPGFHGMRSANECIHPYCRARGARLLLCEMEGTGSFVYPDTVHTHWQICTQCQRTFCFQVIEHGEARNTKENLAYSVSIKTHRICQHTRLSGL